MALTLPANYEKALDLKNINENWIFHLYYGDESNFTAVSMFDTTIDSVKYKGVVSNTPSIRNSIDIFESKAKTSNISIQMINYKYRESGSVTDKQLSDILYSLDADDSDNHYFGRKILVYSQLNNMSALSDCLLLFTGTIKSISHNINSITLNATSKNIWDGIEVGAKKTTSGKNYVPLSFGQFKSSDNSYFKPEYENYLPITATFIKEMDNKKLRPVPYSQVLPSSDYSVEAYGNIHSYNRVAYLIGEQAYDFTDSGDSTMQVPLEYYDNSNDVFMPLSNLSRSSGVSTAQAGNEWHDTETSDHDGAKAFLTTRGIRRGFAIRPESVVRTHTDDDNNFDFDGDRPLTNAIDGDISTSALATFSETASITADNYYSKWQLKFNSPDGSPVMIQDGTISDWKVRIVFKYQIYDCSNDGDTNSYVSFNLAGGDYDVTLMIPDGSTDLDGEIGFSGFNTFIGATDIEFIVKVRVADDGTTTAKIKIYDIYALYEYGLSWENTGDGMPVTYTEQPPEFLYSGVDGVNETYTGSEESAIFNIPQAHRELLYRFTDIGTSDPPNFHNLYSDRGLWFIRDWINEPISLKEKLEQYQYEGGFIFTYENNTPKYIFIKNSYDEDDISATLSDADYSDLNITLTDNIITKWIVEYFRHPAKNNEYLEKIEANTEQRSAFGYGLTKENVKNVKLDTLNQSVPTAEYDGYTGKLGLGLFIESDGDIADVGNRNMGFLNYYASITDRPREILDMTIVNPKFYNLQCGDMVDFDSSEYTKAFSDNLSLKNWIVVQVSKQLGKMKIKLINITKNN